MHIVILRRYISFLTKISIDPAIYWSGRRLQEFKSIKFSYEMCWTLYFRFQSFSLLTNWRVWLWIFLRWYVRWIPTIPTFLKRCKCFIEQFLSCCSFIQFHLVHTNKGKKKISLFFFTKFTLFTRFIIFPKFSYGHTCICVIFSYIFTYLLMLNTCCSIFIFII